jgi:hypothetical protein
VFHAFDAALPKVITASLYATLQTQKKAKLLSFFPSGAYFKQYAFLSVQVTMHRDEFRIKQTSRFIKYPKFILS